MIYLKKITILSCIILSCIGVVFLINYFHIKKQTIRGRYIQTKDDTIEIISNGITYDIKLNPDKLDIPKLKLGNTIELTYTGTLNQTKNIQEIDVIEMNLIKRKQEEFPEAWKDKGLFKDHYKQAYQKLETLNKEEKVGQLFLARVPENNQIEDIKTYHLGGYLMFGKDFKNKTKEEIINTISSYQQASKIPMAIGADEEGGTVVRISSNPLLRSSRFPSPRELYLQGGFDLIKETTKEMGTLLNNLGVNLNLAPVADISIDPNDFIYERSLGQDAKTTSKYIETVIDESKKTNVTFALKHFPGYGNNKDTHTGISTDNRSLEQFKENDFLPFQAGINHGAEMILMSHNIITQVEDNVPASLSPNVHKILRNDLGFTGIIITDDLAMNAITDYVSNPVVKAITSGNDMIIISDYKKGYQEVLNALEDGTITEDYLDYIVFRILSWKYYKGIIK